MPDNLKDIVLVDDEPSALRAMTRTLRMAGLDGIHAFASWEEAEPFVDSRDAGLLILDIIMPGASGVEALHRCRRNNPSLPVIMATCVNEVDTAVECIKAGAVDYLVKPLESGRFLRCVRNALMIHELAGSEGRTGRDSRGVDGRSSARTATETLAIMAQEAKELDPIPRGKLPESQEALLDRCLQMLRGERLYLDPALTLTALSDRLQTNTRYLSGCINAAFGFNFRRLLNSLRIAEFMRRATAEAPETYSIEGLCQSVGFAHKGTFYDAFRQLIGCTPAQWLKGRRVESDGKSLSRK
ncbi:MAG: response regulator [Chitinivibrionales bacterium]|nr:response regulator [Chitinivibrionales bacterium]